MPAHPEAWQPLAGLDTQTQLQSAKRHFVQVDFVDQQYVRHGPPTGRLDRTGQPACGKRTSDREFVARLAARFLDQDFGAVGAVIGKEGDLVRLQLRGGSIAGAGHGPLRACRGGLRA